MITSAGVIIAGGQIFKIAAPCFVNVSEEGINLMRFPGAVNKIFLAKLYD